MIDVINQLLMSLLTIIHHSPSILAINPSVPLAEHAGRLGLELVRLQSREVPKPQKRCGAVPVGWMVTGCCW